MSAYLEWYFTSDQCMLIQFQLRGTRQTYVKIPELCYLHYWIFNEMTPSFLNCITEGLQHQRM